MSLCDTSLVTMTLLEAIDAGLRGSAGSWGHIPGGWPHTFQPVQSPPSVPPPNTITIKVPFARFYHESTIYLAEMLVDTLKKNDLIVHWFSANISPTDACHIFTFHGVHVSPPSPTPLPWKMAPRFSLVGFPWYDSDE